MSWQQQTLHRSDLCALGLLMTEASTRVSLSGAETRPVLRWKSLEQACPLLRFQLPQLRRAPNDSASLSPSSSFAPKRKENNRNTFRKAGRSWFLHDRECFRYLRTGLR